VSREDDIIRASEIGQYAFCARAWWLERALGYRSANVAAMQQGMAGHRRHGKAVERYYLLQRLAVALLLLAVVALAAWLLTSLAR
jgi:3-mercaptopyruvate sulfurtransferase SseA